MRIRDMLSKRLGPGALSGTSLPVWFRVLRDNRFAIDWPYWPRAAVITLATLPNTFAYCCEGLLYNRKIEETEVQPPVFVLGIWRSGTTHLHNLLAVDDRFAFPNFYQVLNPRTFLLTEWSNSWLTNRFLPKKRPQDNVRLATTEPAEDEFALCSLIGRSPLLSIAFPRNADFYDRYMTLRDVSPPELEQWKSASVWFLKKLSFKYARPLVLKSPGHTSRIRILLELFPEARFVHIRRNPYEVFQSVLHTARKLSPWLRLQQIAGDKGLTDQVVAEATGYFLRLYKEVYDAYFAERPQIPEGHLYEVAFEELQENPVGRMKDIYEALDLPAFAHVEPRLQEYVDSLASYKKNSFVELPATLRKRIRTDCQRCFDEWGYPA